MLMAQYIHYFQFTINGEANSILEPGIQSSIEERFQQVEWLAKTFGVGQIRWRFDPITKYLVDGNPYINLEHFERIAIRLSAIGIRHVLIAFCLNYGNCVSRMATRGTQWVPWTFEEKQYVISQMLKPVTDKCGIQIRICSDPDATRLQGVVRGACVNANEFREMLTLAGASLPAVAFRPDAGQKRHGKTSEDSEIGECHCSRSRDIGDYLMRCPHSCSYCYAAPAKEVATEKLTWTLLKDLPFP
jgi:hypothetical protein